MQDTVQVYPISALKDNYIWIIARGGDAYVVDPGESEPVMGCLKAHALSLKGILITHHHHDHVQGVGELLSYQHVPVVASQHSSLREVTHPVHEKSVLRFSDKLPEFQILDIPGHTLDHIAFYGHGMLFCGDTLFGAGCGRIFEGTGKMLYASLQKIAQLPLDTLIYCAHEYTVLNLRFAHHVEPAYRAVSERLEQTIDMISNHQPSLPTSLEIEKRTNPFLRCEDRLLRSAVEDFCGKKLRTAEEVFIALRCWKDSF